MKPAASNLVWRQNPATRADRVRTLGQRGGVVWLTGLSGSGKSTIAGALEKALLENGHAAYVLDGDNIRHGLNADLGFEPEARSENIRRVAEVAALFADAGLIVITALISPYTADRREARRIVTGRTRDGESPCFFLDVYVNTPLAICQTRDPKGLYARAKAGALSGMTGMDAPFEPPSCPDLELAAGELTVETCVHRILDRLALDGHRVRKEEP